MENLEHRLAANATMRLQVTFQPNLSKPNAESLRTNKKLAWGEFCWRTPFRWVKALGSWLNVDHYMAHRLTGEIKRSKWINCSSKVWTANRPTAIRCDPMLNVLDWQSRGSDRERVGGKSSRLAIQHWDRRMIEHEPRFAPNKTPISHLPEHPTTRRSNQNTARTASEHGQFTADQLRLPAAAHKSKRTRRWKSSLRF